MIAQSYIDLIGSTPLMKLNNFSAKLGLKANVYAKLEMQNIGGSVKDRTAMAMIQAAEKDGTLCAGATIIEPTSGNTGISISAIGASKGYKVIMVMPETMSIERRKLIGIFGAEIVLTEGKLGMKGAIDKAQELNDSIPGSVILGQFDNKANAEIHYRTTGKEILKELRKVDAVVAGVGTGGTLTGVARAIKKQCHDAVIVAVEPHDSPILSGGVAGAHKIQGIGAGFVPSILDRTLIDAVMTVEAVDAFDMARLLATTEGLLCGITSGAVLDAIAKLALQEEFAGKNLVAILPDTGERYISTELFNN